MERNSCKYSSSLLSSPKKFSITRKLKDHLRWSNRKSMRTLGGKSPLDFLREILSNA